MTDPNSSSAPDFTPAVKPDPGTSPRQVPPASADRDQPPALSLLSVVIPARDEAGCITSTVEHLHLELALHSIPHEIVVVDDGSADATWRNRRTGVAKLKIREMGSRYFFIVAYVWLEKYFSRGDYRRREQT